MAKFCSKCGSENDDFAQICISCGSPLTISAGSTTDTPEKKRLYLQGMMNLRYYTIVGFLALVAGIVLDFVFMRTLSYGYLVGHLRNIHLNFIREKEVVYLRYLVSDYNQAPKSPAVRLKVPKAGEIGHFSVGWYRSDLQKRGNVHREAFNP